MIFNRIARDSFIKEKKTKLIKSLMGQNRESFELEFSKTINSKNYIGYFQ